MAEASLLFQQAALKVAINFETFIAFQHEELSLRKVRKKLGHKEQKSHMLVMQKVVERVCSELDPIEKFASRKWKLDELCDMLGGELYRAKLVQLEEEYTRASVSRACG